MRSILQRITRMCSRSEANVETFPWAALRHEHVAAIRAELIAQAAAPATSNLALSGIRGVLRSAWRMGQISTDDYMRTRDVPKVGGHRLPAGRALEIGELTALFAACADGRIWGVRDAALLALCYGMGLRRNEAITARVEHYDPENGCLKLTGKGSKERLAFAPAGAARALNAWLAVRGMEAGPILCRCDKDSPRDITKPMSPQAVSLRVQSRARQAHIAPCTPHDLRRTFVSIALEQGADLAQVQRLVGHSNPETTTRYDRRPDAVARAAARLVPVPYCPDENER